MSGLTTDLVEGVALLLVAQVDVAQLITYPYSPSVTYPDGATPVFDEAMPTVPNRAVTLTVYPLTDSPILSDSVQGLQVKTRSIGDDPRDVKDLDHAIFTVLQGIAPVTLTNGIRICLCGRKSGVSLGQDANNRWLRVSNYELNLHYPSLHRV